MNKSEAGKLGAEKTKQVWIDRYESNPKFCQHCDSKLPYKKRKNKYCNHSCAASEANKNRATKNNCLHCEESISKWRKYCSRECQHDHQHQEWIRKWLLEEEKPKTVFDGMSVSNHIKRWLEKKYGKKCSICDWNKTNKYSNTIPLHVDHIDGNSENNNPENLRFLCPNCHSLTPNYGSLNRGNGRAFRRKKRKENPEVYI